MHTPVGIVKNGQRFDISASLDLLITPDDLVPQTTDQSGGSGNQTETGPFAINGHYPLYNTVSGAEAASNTNSSHEHNLNGITYHMPSDGTTLFHGDYTIPIISASTDTDGTIITLVLENPIVNNSPNNDNFTVTSNSQNRSVSAVGISANVVVLTLADNIYQDETVVMTVNQNVLKDSNNNPVTDGNISVTNNSIQSSANKYFSDLGIDENLIQGISGAIKNQNAFTSSSRGGKSRKKPKVSVKNSFDAILAALDSNNSGKTDKQIRKDKRIAKHAYFKSIYDAYPDLDRISMGKDELPEINSNITAINMLVSKVYKTKADARQNKVNLSELETDEAFHTTFDIGDYVILQNGEVNIVFHRNANVDVGGEK